MANGMSNMGPKLPKIRGATPKLPKVPGMPSAPTVGASMRPPSVTAPAMKVKMPSKRTRL
jgi:hypothetical protein